MKQRWSALLRLALIPVLGVWSLTVNGAVPAIATKSSGVGLAVAVGAAATESSTDALLLLLEQNRNLQSEVQALRSLVEEQGYALRQLQRESLDRYTDSDTRLSAIEQSMAGQGSTTASATPAVPRVGAVAAPAIPPINASVTPSPAVTASSGAVIQPAPASTSVATETPIVTPAIQSSTTPIRPALEPMALSEQQLYQMAYESAVNSQFERAIAEFDQYLSSYPEGRFVTNVYYWRGQSFLYLSRFQEAIDAYETILQNYPDAPKVPDAMYGLGVAFEGMGNIQRARQLMQEIKRTYPNTGVANLADTRLRSLE